MLYFQDYKEQDSILIDNEITFAIVINPLRGWNLEKRDAYDEIVRLTENDIVKAVINR